MILASEVATKFKALLSQSDAWKSLIDSQFIKHLSIFVGWGVEDAAYKAERARHEAFIDTALNRSSILAHGEGMEYMPIKPIPSSGSVTILNNGDAQFTLLYGQELFSDDQTAYAIQDTVIVPAKSSINVNVKQYTMQEYTFTVSEAKAFYEILLDQDISSKVVSFKVAISEDGGATFEDWAYDRLLLNAYSNSKVYDEFYHFTDQIGIRFGNGIFGAIPTEGSIVKVVAMLTEGDVVLMAKQDLYLTEDVYDDDGNAVDCEITVADNIQGGSNQEDTETMRRNLHYAALYHERLVWANDYKFFMRRTCPDIVWCVAWGEETSEKMWGYNVEHINRIWLCAYSPDRDVHDKVMEAIKGVTFICRNQMWYEPEHVHFTVKIKGNVLKDTNIAEVKSAIKSILDDMYGKASTNRRENVLLHEIYDALYDTGYFNHKSGAWFEVELHGTTSPEFIYQMVSIDLDGSEFEINYVE